VGAGLPRQLAGKHCMQPVISKKPRPGKSMLNRWSFQPGPERDDGKLQGRPTNPPAIINSVDAKHGRKRETVPACRKPPTAKPAMTIPADRKLVFAEFEQERREIRNNPQLRSTPSDEDSVITDPRFGS